MRAKSSRDTRGRPASRRRARNQALGRAKISVGREVASIMPRSSMLRGPSMADMPETAVMRISGREMRNRNSARPRMTEMRFTFSRAFFQSPFSPEMRLRPWVQISTVWMNR